MRQKKKNTGKMEEKEEKSSARPVSPLKGGITSIVITILFIFSVTMTVPLMSQYVHSEIEKGYFISSNESDKVDVCHKNLSDNHTRLLDQIQKETSEKILLYSYAGTFPSLVINLVLGSYSDFLGRKMLFLFPMVGSFSKDLITCLIIKLNLDMDLFYLANCLGGFGGSFGAFSLAIYSYIADISPATKTRTLVMTAVEGSLAVAAGLSFLATGYIIGFFGFFYTSLTPVCLTAIAILLIIFLLPETVQKPTEKVWSPVSHLKNVFGFFLFRGTVRSRIIFTLWLFVFFLAMLATLGRFNVETIYQLGEPFCWTSMLIGIFGALKLFAAVIFSVLAIKIGQKFMRDEIIAILGTIDLCASFVVEGLAKTTEVMFLVPVVGLIGIVTSPISRSALSLMTPPSKQGAIFSAFSTVEGITGLVSSTLFHEIYQATVGTYKGAVFIIMAGISSINILLLGLIIVLSRKQNQFLPMTI